jgi:hypothetical protein
MIKLVNREDYKRFKGLTSSSSDAQIDQLVISISSLVKTYCGTTFRDYYDTDKTEYYTIHNTSTSELFLDESPVVSITSLKERTSQASPYVELTTGAYEYNLESALSIITRTNDVVSKAFPKGFNSVEVIYKSGYQYTPKDLELAIYDLITYYLKEEHKKDRAIVNTTISNTGTTSVKNDTGFPDHIRRVLDLYKVNSV